MNTYTPQQLALHEVLKQQRIFDAQNSGVTECTNSGYLPYDLEPLTFPTPNITLIRHRYECSNDGYMQPLDPVIWPTPNGTVTEIITNKSLNIAHIEEVVKKMSRLNLLHSMYSWKPSKVENGEGFYTVDISAIYKYKTKIRSRLSFEVNVCGGCFTKLVFQIKDVTREVLVNVSNQDTLCKKCCDRINKTKRQLNIYSEEFIITLNVC